MKFFYKVIGSLKDPHFLFLVSLAFITNILILSNILQSDYFGDDLYNFQVPGKVPYQFESISAYAISAVKGWMSIGRFFPVGNSYLWFLYDWFDTIYSYKLIMITLIMISHLLFSYFIYLFSKKNKHLTLLVLLITPILFQYKLYHDPILSFHGLMPLMFIFLITSLIFLLKHLQKSNKLFFIISLVSFISCLFTYEVAHTFIFIYILVISSQFSIRANTSKYLRVFLPYLFISFGIALYIIYLRSLYDMPLTNNPYLPNWYFASIIKTYFLQVVSVLPTSYYFNYGRFPYWYDFGSNFIFLAVFFIYIFISSFNYKEDKGNFFKYLFILAILILLLPGAPIALSTKFQGFLGEANKVQFGLPYIPIYIQTFGLSLLLSLLISKVTKTKNIIFIMIVLGMVWTIHTVSNNQVIRAVNVPYKDTRIVLTLFFSKDLKDKLNNGDLIWLDGDNPFTHTNDFVSFVSKKNIKMARQENDNYLYHVSFEVAKDSAFINVYDTALEKNFLFPYQKIDNIWSIQSNQGVDKKERTGLIKPFFNNF